MLSRVASAWSRFWFTPRSSVTITAARVGLGITVVAWGLAVLPDLRTFYFDDRILPAARYTNGRIGVFQWLGSDAAIVVLFLVMMVAAVALVVGKGVRVAAPVLWLCMCSFQQEATSVLNAGDLLIRIWAAYFALFALFTPNRFLTVPLFGRRAADGTRSYPLAPGWIVRVMQIQLTVIYAATVVEKLPGDTWREGTAALYALGLTDFERFALPDFFRENLLLGNIFTWATIGLEIALPFLLWTKRTRFAAIIAGLGMHLAFDYTMRLGFFLWAMLIGYLAFFTTEELERFFGWVRRGRTQPDTSDHREPPDPSGRVEGDEPVVEPAGHRIAGAAVDA